MHSFEEATIDRIHNAYQDGLCTCRTLIQWYLNRIDKYDAIINSIITINPQALAEADACDAKIRQNGITAPLMGIPVLVKDNIETAGMPTTAGSIALQNYRPAEDAPLIRALRRAGAIILGKTNLHEFAIWGETISSIKGQTYNPYDFSRTPGGSSGGTGAAIASNFAVLGIGTDTVNSVRSPASANALVGIRPTHGLINDAGIVPYARCQDTAGPICRTVTDAAVTLAIIAGNADDFRGMQSRVSVYQNAIHHASLSGKRIGILTPFWGTAPIHDAVNAQMASVLELLKINGVTCIDVTSLSAASTVDVHSNELSTNNEITMPFDAHWLVENVSLHLYAFKDDLNSFLKAHCDATTVQSLSEIIEKKLYHPNIESHLKEALRYDQHSAAFARRKATSEALRLSLTALFDRLKLDALVYPHQQRLVCKVGERQLDRNGVLSAISGFPAVTVPAGFSSPSLEAPIGVPIGVEFLGRPYDEAELIAIAYAFEQLTHYRRAPQEAK
ncbi:amidase [Fusibacter paucivorans]|uniref:Amidase n=1 Tax=Fusibacter paucivorans TaxID=76009 RepID=A0ABS5PM19_9FIRM|nr:amidase family protein [Fusibacter paucivorans]MBS7526224.1 amidase [Fusibacter paucivorans]